MYGVAEALSIVPLMSFPLSLRLLQDCQIFTIGKWKSNRRNKLHYLFAVIDSNLDVVEVADRGIKRPMVDQSSGPPWEQSEDLNGVKPLYFDTKRRSSK